MPSTSTRMPFGPLAIWRMIATVPTLYKSAGPGSSASLCCRSRRTMRSPASARLIASTDIGRFTPSGATVKGSTTVPRIGMTGSSAGIGGVCGVSGIVRPVVQCSPPPSSTPTRCGRPSVDAGEHAPADPAAVRFVVHAEDADQALLLPRDGDGEIPGAEDRESELRAGHHRGAEHEEDPRKIQRVPHEAI